MSVQLPIVLGSLLLAGLWLAAPACGQAVGAAYESEVIGHDAGVYSGPGLGFYPTALLRRGTPVTVVGPMVDGWAPIVPPTGSHSWISAADVIEQEDGSGLVNVEQSRVRIGSELNDARHVFQVLLKRGDRVSILDQAVRSGSGKIETLFKILPPANEVRYIEARHLRPVPTMTRPLAPPLTSTQDPPPTGAVVQSLTGRVIPPAEPVAVSRSTIAAKRRVGADAEPIDEPPLQFNDDPRQTPDRRLASIDNYLELMRSRLPTSWDLESVERALASLNDPATAGKRDLVRGRLTRMQELQTIYLRSWDRRRLALQKDQELEALMGRQQQQLAGQSLRHQATGLLRRAAVYSEVQPVYSLLNDQGYVTHQVVPTAGLSLEACVGKRVGVIGREETGVRRATPLLRANQVDIFGDDPLARTLPNGAPSTDPGFQYQPGKTSLR